MSHSAEPPGQPPHDDPHPPHGGGSARPQAERGAPPPLAAAGQSGKEYTFSILDSDIPNAFALPGGPIYIHSGLIAAADNEAQMAGVPPGMLDAAVGERLAFLSDGLSHAAFGGMGVCYFLGINPLIGAVALALAAALGLGAVNSETVRAYDTMIGVLWAVGMAVGTVFLYLTPGYAPNLMTWLFGNILLVTQEEIVLMLVFGALVVVPGGAAGAQTDPAVPPTSAPGGSTPTTAPGGSTSTTSASVRSKRASSSASSSRCRPRGAAMLMRTMFCASASCSSRETFGREMWSRSAISCCVCPRK